VAAAIEIEELSKTYRHAQAVVNLTLSIPTGQVLGLLGPNGAGKTTALKLLAGLLLPDKGSVHLNGYDVVRERELARQQVAAVVQGMRQPGGRLARGGAEVLLRELGLWECREVPVGSLSHGLQRRAVLADVLSADVPILLLDEPTFGLDRHGAHTIGIWIRRLACERDKTVVLATCQQQLAQDLCDRVVVLQNGHLVADVPVRSGLGLDRPATYQIRVKGGLDARWAAWFDGLTVTAVRDETIIAGPVIDQPALHGLLVKIRDLGLPLVSVHRVEPELVETHAEMCTLTRK
jgi:ABC-2 type transport system ATP-binding protein